MKLASYIAQRIMLIIPVLIGLTLLTFTLSHIVPGDPALLAAGQQATAEMVEQIRQEFGLDKPLYVQYGMYIKGLLTGDWGRSILSRRPVLEDLRVFWPATFELVSVGMLIAIVIGIPLGVVSAVMQGRWPDHFSRVYALLGVSIPAFWLALLLQWFIALRFGFLPIGGRINSQIGAPETITGLYILDSILTMNGPALKSALTHILLPAITLSMPPLATITRMTRSSMLETLNQEYIRTARAKGLSERVILLRHALRNAFLPTLTMVGLSIGWLMGGSVLVETIYDWPGIGLYAVKSAMSLDFMPIMGITFIYGVIFSLINLVVDLLYAAVDPRIQLT
jgi:ABC-type dipeptide/oligopeptide/nickel transport systems, permease components